MLTAAGGLGVIHLGTDLPANDIVLAARKSGANALLLSVSKAPDAEVLTDILHIASKLQRSTALWLGGAPQFHLENAIQGSHWQVINDFQLLERELSGLGARF
jgi:hypothetical protein